MHDRTSGLRRIPLPRTSVNRYKTAKLIANSSLTGSLAIGEQVRGSVEKIGRNGWPGDEYKLRV
jgi:hypothetical protein